MPRKKKTEAAEEVIEVPSEIREEVVAIQEIYPQSKLIELNGRRYYEIFNPMDGTTHLTPVE